MTATDYRLRDLLRQAPPAELDAQLERYHQLRRAGVELHGAQRAAFGRAQGDVLLARVGRRGLWHVPGNGWGYTEEVGCYGLPSCSNSFGAYELVWVPRDAAIDLFEIKDSDPVWARNHARVGDPYGDRNTHLGKRACADCFDSVHQHAATLRHLGGYSRGGAIWIHLLRRTHGVGLRDELLDVRCLLGEHLEGQGEPGKRAKSRFCIRCLEDLS